MSVVMLVCQATEREFSSGILTDEFSFRSLPDVEAEARCPHCADTHSWRPSQARLVDAIPPGQWVNSHRIQRKGTHVSFDPKTLNLMRGVLAEAWAHLLPHQQAQTSRSELAERILKAAAQGERDPLCLRAHALAAIGCSSNRVGLSLSK